MDNTTDIFGPIAHSYDRWSFVLSAAGIYFWHRAALHEMHIKPGQTILDAGCGTGHETRVMAAKTGPKGQVIGLDPSAEMLALAKQSPLHGQCAPIEWIQGEAESIPFADHTFDRVVAQFSLRNMTNWREGLHHLIRVLKPDGRLVILEMVQPVTAQSALAWKTLRTVTRGFRSPTLERYRWLSESLWHAPTAQELMADSTKTGLHLTVTRHWLGGLVVVLSGSPAIFPAPYQPSAPIVIWALDGSLSSLRARAWMTQHLPPSFEIHLLTVIPVRSLNSAILHTEVNAWLEAQKQARSEWPSDSRKIVPIILYGPPAQEIVSYASRVHAALIVLGYKKRHPLAHRLTGGSAQYVLDHAPCPVLTVGLPD